MTDLTEQWKKGELDIDECYFAETEGGIYKATGEYLNNSSCINGFDITSILELVPSYDEWKASEKYNKHLEEVIKVYERKDKQATETSIAYNELLEENAQLKEELSRESYKVSEAYCFVEELKELLKECRPYIEDFTVTVPNEKIFLQEHLTKIDEVLK